MGHILEDLVCRYDDFSRVLVLLIYAHCLIATIYVAIFFSLRV